MQLAQRAGVRVCALTLRNSLKESSMYELHVW